MRVLELGCGTGDMWKRKSNLITKCAELVLTDFSEGMIQTAHSTIGDFPNVTYRVVDIQEIPFEMNKFDIVIANMMLYHVPDLGKGLSEVKRVFNYFLLRICQISSPSNPQFLYTFSGFVILSHSPETVAKSAKSRIVFKAMQIKAEPILLFLYSGST